MKAFKQINFRVEHHFFWSYSIAASILSILILISPVIAQTNKIDTIEPEIQIHVQKEFDEDGNLVRIDSSQTWRWQGKSFTLEQQDSIVKRLEENMGNIFHRNQVSPFGSFGMPPGPPLHRFWDWQEADSSVTSFFDQFYDREFFNPLDGFSKPDINWDFLLNDSLWTSQDFFDKYFNDDMFKVHQKRMQEFGEHFKEYQEEHQQLIEKFFGQPWQNEEFTPPIEPNLNYPDKLTKENKSGNI